jgi:hypothetical protein
MRRKSHHPASILGGSDAAVPTSHPGTTEYFVMEWFLAVLLLSMIACAIFGSYIATEKGRDSSEGILFGALLGLLGLLILVLLPNKDRSHQKKRINPLDRARSFDPVPAPRWDNAAPSSSPSQDSVLDAIRNGGGPEVNPFAGMVIPPKRLTDRR